MGRGESGCKPEEARRRFRESREDVPRPVFEAVNGRDYRGERRIKAIGEAEGLHLVVVYTWRGDVRRIISAWKAGRNDREKYKKAIAG
jgi:uncharacterized DUF497 family protein